MDGSLGPPEFSTENGVSIGSAVFAGLTSDRQTKSCGRVEEWTR